MYRVLSVAVLSSTLWFVSTAVPSEQFEAAERPARKPVTSPGGGLNLARVPAVGGVQFDSQISRKFSSSRAQKAEIIKAQDRSDGYYIEVQSADGNGRFFVPSATHLWCAYNFLKPNDELVADFPELKNPERYRGLVTAISDGTNATATLHAAVKDTSIGKDIARVDLLVSWMASSPAQPSELYSRLGVNQGRQIQWKHFRYNRLIWYDDETVIKIKNDRLSVEPISDPKSCVMRIRFWQPRDFNDEVGFDSYYGFWEHIPYVMSEFKPLNNVDEFCRCVAVLKWLKECGCLPNLPAEVKPVRDEIDSSVKIEELMTIE